MRFILLTSLLFTFSAALPQPKGIVHRADGATILSSGVPVNSQLVGYQSLTSISGWSSTARYASANSTGPQANTTGFTVWAVFLPNTNTANQMIIAKSTGITSTQGWALGSSSGTYRFSVGNGSTSLISPGIGFADVELGRMCTLHGVVRGGQIYMYKDGVPVFGSTSIAAYTSSAFGVTIGSFAAGTQFLSGIIACGVASSTGMTDDDVNAHYQALLADAYAIPTGATHLWRSIDTSPSTAWVDHISSLSCARTGTPTFTSDIYAFYDRYDYRVWASDVTALSPQLPNTAGSLDVMFVGDSRTVGVGGTNTNSFRQGVYTLYTASGDMTNTNFVGPTTSTATDPQHDGNTGWRSIDHLTGIGAQISISTALSTYNPDIVVIYLGTNSASSDANMASERVNYLTLVNTIYMFNNNIRFVFIEETETAGGNEKARLEAHNNWFWRSAWPSLAASGVKLIRVKMYENIKVSAGDYSDAVHPNDAGYAKMVNAIYDGIRKASGR